MDTAKVARPRKNYAFTGAGLHILCFYDQDQLVTSLFHLAPWIPASIFPVALFYELSILKLPNMFHMESVSQRDHLTLIKASGGN